MQCHIHYIQSAEILASVAYCCLMCTLQLEGVNVKSKYKTWPLWRLQNAGFTLLMLFTVTTFGQYVMRLSHVRICSPLVSAVTKTPCGYGTDCIKGNVLRPLSWYRHGHTMAMTTGVLQLKLQVYSSYRYGHATGIYIRATAADLRII